MLRALIWDVDGTVAETEADGHRIAFNQAFEACGLDWHWDLPTYGQLLEVTGGRERLLAYMDRRDDAPASPAGRAALARAVHLRKNAFYADLVARGGIPARPGVRRGIMTGQMPPHQPRHLPDPLSSRGLPPTTHARRATGSPTPRSRESAPNRPAHHKGRAVCRCNAAAI